MAVWIQPSREPEPLRPHAAPETHDDGPFCERFANGNVLAYNCKHHSTTGGGDAGDAGSLGKS
ncbi:hypothetical protein L248_0023 [Schleiferilactobacillus shenzhenensis LY-73]|uniref:Uncharacterized protein n=1 Tax=Schleiferilactobacillus shenzhenensis LY-73 TaxID=1231336 RepID=U4TX10_9LACO|nr:hypothetical protein L248_0023 [Schleiferilactobacillus shenzhenensis LY-73]